MITTPIYNKVKGSIGEYKVISDLLFQGYNVFQEVTNATDVDLIATKEDKLYRIQVKSRTLSDDGTVTIQTRRGRGGIKSVDYKPYNEKDVDIFAIHVLNTEIFAYVPASIILSRSHKMIFRIGEGSSENCLSMYRRLENSNGRQIIM